MDNPEIADRLEAFATLLELVEGNPYTIRAYRRAADTIRGAAVPVAELVRSGRARELRGIGRGIEARLSELVETGSIAELAELEREVTPDLVGLGAISDSARSARWSSPGHWVRTADELSREAAAAGRLRSVPGIGPKTEAQLLDALSREAERAPAVACCWDRAWELVGGSRRPSTASWRATCGAGATPEQLVVVCNNRCPAVLARFATFLRSSR